MLAARSLHATPMPLAHRMAQQTDDSLLMIMIFMMQANSLQVWLTNRSS
jgi:hypothetical protein